MARPGIGGHIKVTKELIAVAKPKDSGHCMVADAVRARFPQATDVLVDLQVIRYTDRKAGKRYAWLTPPTAQSALIRFDQGEELEPFDFALHRPIHIRPIRSGPSRPNRARRPVTGGPSHVVHAERSRPVVTGGRLPPVAVLSNTRGRVRGFGLRQLKP